MAVKNNDSISSVPKNGVEKHTCQAKNHTVLSAIFHDAPAASGPRAECLYIVRDFFLTAS